MRISIGTPCAWQVRTAWVRAHHQFVQELADDGHKLQVILSEGSVIDRNWSTILGSARKWKPDWFIGLESDVHPTIQVKDLIGLLKTTRLDAIVSPGNGVTGWMWRDLRPESLASVHVGARMIQDFSFWQNVRSTGARIYCDPAVSCDHFHATGFYSSFTAEGVPFEVFEGWQGFFAIRGWVLQELRPLFRMADVDYYCASNDLRRREPSYGVTRSGVEVRT